MMTTPRSHAPWHTYVAVGDSASEGLWDLDEAGNLWGWTDRLAYHLAERVAADPHCQGPSLGHTLRYANLAIRGQLMSQILATQVPQAIRMGADLVSITAGGNDMLRPNVSVARLSARLASAVKELRSRGIDVLLVTSSDPAGSPFIEATRGRVTAFNASLWSIARRYDCAVVDQWGLPALRTWPAWSEDRLHLAPTAHALVARAALLSLGFDVDRESLYQVPSGWEDRAATHPSDWTWLQRHALPWAKRHLRGRSSGDGRTAKRPVPTAVDLAVPPPAVEWPA